MGEIVRVLVGNKIDLESENDVAAERGRQVAENCGIDKNLFFEISALEGTGFDEMFEDILRAMRKCGKDATATASLILEENPNGKTDDTKCACTLL